MKVKDIDEILSKVPCIDNDCGGQGGTWQGDPENPEPVQCQYCYQERYPFIEEAKQALNAHYYQKMLGIIGEDGKGCDCEDEIGYHSKYCENNGTFYQHLFNNLRAEQRAKLEQEFRRGE